MNKVIGSKVRIARKERELTQAELGEKLNISGAALAYIELGQRNITVEFLQNVSKVLDKPLHFFISDLQGTDELTLKELVGRFDRLEDYIYKGEHNEKSQMPTATLLENAFLQARCGLMFLSPDYRVKIYNEEATRVLKIEHPAGRQLSELISDAVYTSTAIIPMVEEQGYWKGVVDTDDDYGRKPLLMTVSKITGATEEDSGYMVGFIEDHGVQRVNEVYRKLITSIDLPFAEVEISGKFVYANDQYCKFVGYSREELYQLTYLDIIINPSAKGLEAITRQLHKHGHVSGTCFMRNKKGEPLLVRFDTCVKDSGRSISLIRKFVRVTEEAIPKETTVVDEY